jgi:hypothetical protein
MAKKIGLGFLLSFFLTWIMWRLTALLPLGRTADDVLFLSSPVVAIAMALILIRKKYY